MYKDEKTLKEPFWAFEAGESSIVDTIFRRRFPETYAILAESLESADPMEIVYPNNPNEYNDVIHEMIVLVAHENGSFESLTLEQIEELVTEGFAKCFGEPPDSERVQKAARLIAARSRRGHEHGLR